ncbi:fimbrial protein [Serratia fonticola]|jgi:type 1 fimbria pilin|uniref:fimbrial protein n=1 Tax=Serratia fonticola TaxID=47917 RepID=UPI000FC16628|nr:fimbrial protein [Serratia fonticola]CAI1611653.1 Fimbrial adapter papK precursor [Serratia fonticola]
MNISYLWASLIALAFYLPSCEAIDNLKFEGELVKEPCVIAPGDEAISLDFGSIIDKQLYAHERTESQDFAIHLINCDITMAKTVHIALSGTASNGLPGYLAVTGSEADAGLAIGLENALSGEPISINSQTEQNISLTAGSTDIRIRAFLRAEPEALVHKTIVRGAFSGILNFSLRYD